MLQWEINRFLDPLSRLQWNQVLKSDERVYKKFPKDYAIKHQIKLSLESYRDLTWKLKNNIDRIWFRGHFHVENLLGAVKLLKKFFAFFKDPKNQMALMYIEDQDRFLQSIGQWTELDMDLYTYLPGPAAALALEAVETLNIVANIPFLRNVSVAGYKNVFE